eukprot:190212_1
MAQEADKVTSNVIDKGGYADARNRCPHVNTSLQMPSDDELKKLSKLAGNPECSIKECDKKECWVCVHCHETYCGRYGNQHMIKHYKESDNKHHCIALGIGDLSFWCY